MYLGTQALAGLGAFLLLTGTPEQRLAWLIAASAAIALRNSIGG